MAFQSGGSQGLKVIWPLRTRNPPDPLTINLPGSPADAMWMPSSVLPRLSTRSTNADRRKYWTARPGSPTSMLMLEWIAGLNDDLCSVSGS
jgi:hypothetical protein